MCKQQCIEQSRTNGRRLMDLWYGEFGLLIERAMWLQRGCKRYDLVVLPKEYR